MNNKNLTFLIIMLFICILISGCTTPITNSEPYTSPTINPIDKPRLDDLTDPSTYTGDKNDIECISLIDWKNLPANSNDPEDIDRLVTGNVTNICKYPVSGYATIYIKDNNNKLLQDTITGKDWSRSGGIQIKPNQIKNFRISEINLRYLPENDIRDQSLTRNYTMILTITTDRIIGAQEATYIDF